MEEPQTYSFVCGALRTDNCAQSPDYIFVIQTTDRGHKAIQAMLESEGMEESAAGSFCHCKPSITLVDRLTLEM